MRWIWLVVLCACGDNVTPRLTPLTYDLAGTTFTMPQQFHDRQRDEDCSPVTWADAATYCTPAYQDAVYTNSGCSEPIAQGDAAYVATYFSLGGQTSLRRLHPVEEHTAAPAQYWQLAQGSCTGPFTPDPTTTWHTLGAELDESAFVRLYRSAPEGRGRLQQIAWNTRDGLHAFAGLHDRDLAIDCALAPEQDAGTVACMPIGTVPTTLFADPACTVRAILSSDQMPAFAKWDCMTVAPVTTELPGPNVYARNDAGTCRMVTVLNTRIFAVGAPVELVTLDRERGAGDRIAPITLVAGDLRIPDAWVHDTQLDVDCQPGLLSRELRCLPAVTSSVETYYTDDQCAQAIDVALIDPAACEAPAHYAYRPDAFHRIGATVTQQLYVPSTGDRCMAGLIPGLEPHAIGGPLPVETFVPAL